MIRLILDTNVVVSTTLRAGGLPDTLFKLGVTRTVQLCVSEAVLADCDEVCDAQIRPAT